MYFSAPIGSGHFTTADLVDTLLAKLTPDEKVAQLGGALLTDLLTEGDLDEAELNAQLARGVGQVARPGALSG